MRTYAFDVRHLDTDAVVAVALVMPAMRRISVLTAEGRDANDAELSSELWDEIYAWTTDADLNLPKQPPPLSTRVVSALLTDTDPSTLIARRFAAFPEPHVINDPTLWARALAGLLSVRRSAA